MPNIAIHQLLKSEDNGVLISHARPMRVARLESLRVDPTHFCSKYEDEVKQDLNFWVDRLRPRYVRHFVAVQQDNQTIGERLVIDEKTEFKGFMVVINEFEQAVAENAKEGEVSKAILENELPTYFLGALWVHSSLRGQGIGSRMIQDSMKWTKEDAKSKGWAMVKYRVTAMNGNDRAVALYRRLGFVIDQNERGGAVHDDIHTQLSMVIETDSAGDGSVRDSLTR